MPNKGCNDCEHYRSGKLNMWKDDDPRSCVLGKTTEMNTWWEENARKTDKNTITDMVCYTETKLGELLGELGRLLDELKNKIK